MRFDTTSPIEVAVATLAYACYPNRDDVIPRYVLEVRGGRLRDRPLPERTLEALRRAAGTERRAICGGAARREIERCARDQLERNRLAWRERLTHDAAIAVGLRHRPVENLRILRTRLHDVADVRCDAARVRLNQAAQHDFRRE